MKTTTDPTYNRNGYVHTIDLGPEHELENTALLIKSLCKSAPTIGDRLKQCIDLDKRRLINARNDDLRILCELLGDGVQQCEKMLDEFKELPDLCQSWEAEFRAPMFEAFLKLAVAIGLDFDAVDVDTSKYEAAIVSIPAAQVPTPPPQPTPPKQMHLSVFWTEATTRKQLLWPPVQDGRASDKELMMMRHADAIETANMEPAQ